MDHDTADEASTLTALTPPTATAPTIWDGRYYAVPCPGHTFMIVEKHSKRVMTLSDNDVLLRAAREGHEADASQQWRCVQRNGWYGLMNPLSGKYLGHDGNNGVCCRAHKHDLWENFVPRRHVDGGYELLLPHWWWGLRVVAVAGDGAKLCVRDDGTTVWEFVRL